MIQRIQTIYLFLSALAAVVCLCLPIAWFSIDGELVITVSNLFTTNSSPLAADSGPSFATLPLFLLLVLSACSSVATIFLYRNRKLQATLCAFLMLMLIGWYILFAVYAHVLMPQGPGAAFHPNWSCALPAVALAMLFMARRGIIHDERLVRAADRIR